MIPETKAVLAAACLAVASLQDIRAREVDDRVWLVMGPAGAVLTAVEVLLSRDPYSYAIVALGSAAAAFLLGLAMFYLGLAGGADAKCLWCIGLTFPWHPWASWEGAWPSGTYLPLFPVTIFDNAAVVSLAVVGAIFATNLSKLLRGEPLFKGLEGESPLKKAALLFVALRVDSLRVTTGDFYRALEVLEDGARRITFSTSPTGEVPPGRIWAMPVLPFIVNLTIGLAVGVLYGDLALAIASILYVSLVAAGARIPPLS